jgi:radical SAM superfamily enzyme YgiQ (UPF0313 family)
MKKHPPSTSDFSAHELGARRKKWKGRLPVALIFPNLYQLGMSNLGFQLVYDLLNRSDDLVCERIFLPQKTGEIPRSVESGRALDNFPLIFFSVSFEQDFFNIVKMLASGGVPPLAADRGGQCNLKAAGRPLVIGGGVATFINPEPVAPFFDAIIIGEAEPVLPALVAFILDHLDAGEKEPLLFDMARQIPGCYVPRFYSMKYGADGLLAAIEAEPGLPPRVKKVTQPPPETAGYSRLLSPDAEFANLFLTELGRGCSRGCRFCAAGFVYRPPRLWTVESILKAFANRPPEIERVGLLGMEMASGEDLKKISEFLLAEGCALSFSSLRADALGPELYRLLEKSRPKSVAIAPDGGSERLRRVINKGISEGDVLQAAEALARAGIVNLKLYFMIGLPTETLEDLEELVGLTMKVKAILLQVGRSRGRLGNMTLSVNCFVPKAWTPFQYHPFAPLKELKDKLKFLKGSLGRESNVRLSAESPKNAFFQAVLARGDRRVGIALAQMVTEGSDWRQVLKISGLSPEDYAMRPRGKDEVFPWEVIDHSIDRRYLWAEYLKALAARTTSLCTPATCRRCGVCHD